MPKAPSPTESLIDRAFARRAQIAALIEEQKADELKIIELGPGKHRGSDESREIQVIAAGEGTAGIVGYSVPADGEAKARELAGEKFAVLFDRVVSYAPIEGFAHVVPTHLTPAKARGLLALCRWESKGTAPRKAYLLWPKAPKP
jgi:hypothetical protein